MGIKSTGITVYDILETSGNQWLHLHDQYTIKNKYVFLCMYKLQRRSFPIVLALAARLKTVSSRHKESTCRENDYG